MTPLSDPLPALAAGVGKLPLAPLDLVGCALVVGLVALGFWRGLWWQVIRLLGIVAAVATARALSGPLAVTLAERWAESLSPRVVYGLAWFSVFLLALGAATLFGLLGQKLLDAMHLGLANRVGGGLVGAATGLLLHLAILLTIVQLAPPDFISSSFRGTFSERLVDRLGTSVPAVLSVQAGEEVRRVLASPPAAEGPSASDSEAPEPVDGAAHDAPPDSPPDDGRPRVR